MPQQPNDIDCGIHALVGIRTFVDKTVDYEAFNLSTETPNKNDQEVTDAIRKHMAAEIRVLRLLVPGTLSEEELDPPTEDDSSFQDFSSYYSEFE